MATPRNGGKTAAKEKEAATPGAELVAAGDSEFAVVQFTAEGGTLAEVLTENVGGSSTGVFDLDRVKVPSGGGRAWELPTLEGDPDIQAVFEGIVVAWRDPRAYWSVPFDQTGGGTPPDCGSSDGVIGVGDPGGECARCPLSQFGSDPREDSNAQACKQMRLMLILTPQSLLPFALFAPPTSIGPIRKYFLRLAGQGLGYNKVVTRFSLEKQQSGGGIDYSRIVPTMARRLEATEVPIITDYSAAIKGAFDTITVTARDVQPDAFDDGQ